MVGVKDNNLVSLITSDLNPAEAIIQEYPGIITGEQVEKTRIKGVLVYLFRQLDLKELKSFLAKHNSDKYMIAAITE